MVFMAVIILRSFVALKRQRTIVVAVTHIGITSSSEPRQMTQYDQSTDKENSIPYEITLISFLPFDHN